MPQEPLFTTTTFSPDQREQLDRDGHLLFPGLLTEDSRARLTASLSSIHEQSLQTPTLPCHYAGEHDPYLAELIAHPDLLDLARWTLGPELRFDHCVSLIRPANDNGSGWHSHKYADERPELGFVRIFFYVNGFRPDDGGLGVVPGSHLFRDSRLSARKDEDLEAGWMAGKVHPLTGEPLQIDYLTAPPGSVILMWTHAAHAVSPRKVGSPTRWTVVYAYRNPGEESHARWITEEFEKNPPNGAEGLMSLY